MHRSGRGGGSGTGDELPLDPFAGDPGDPSAALEQLDDPDEAREPLSPADREGVLTDLTDLDGFRALLEPRGVRGLVVDCLDCAEPHWFSWDLLAADLRHLLDSGQAQVHEPAFRPDPAAYVSWDYARGFADGVLDSDPEP